MIDSATRSGEKERFVLANGLATRKGWASGNSAGLTWHIDSDTVRNVFASLSSRTVADARHKPVKLAFVAPTRQEIDLAPYSGQWVVISNDRVAEYGADLADVVRRARQRGDSKPYVVFVERLAEGAARIGI